jgi:hypothetical protein
VTLLVLLVGCDPPAQIYPVGACRMGDLFADVAVEVTCASGGEPLTADLAWAADTRAGGTQGEGWDGTGFYATGLSAGGGTLSVGHRPGALGVYGLEGGRSLTLGYLPAGDTLPGAPSVTLTDGTTTCDAATGVGTARVTGLPDEWVEGGVWEMTFDAGVATTTPVAEAWASSWPAACPLAPESWATLEVSAACEGVEAARIQFLAPSAYAVELDVLGQVDTVSATWTDAFSARCRDGDLPALAGSLQGEGGALRIYTPVLSVVRGVSGAWAVEATECGACAAWEVTVDGLPDL